MWSQFPGVCNSSVNRRYNSLRISIIRPAMVRISRFHSSNSPASLRISDTYAVRQLPECASYLTTTYQACTIRRWIANFTPLQHRQLAVHPVRRLCIGRHNMQRTHSLTVQPRILRKTLQSVSFISLPSYSHECLLTWQTNNGNPCSTKYRTAHASLSRSPLAKPWYAQSKNE